MIKRTNINLTDEDIQCIEKLKVILKGQTGLDLNTTQVIRYALKRMTENVEGR